MRPVYKEKKIDNADEDSTKNTNKHEQAIDGIYIKRMLTLK